MPLTRRKVRNNRLATPGSGRSKEIAFHHTCSPASNALGLKLPATLGQRDWSDYVIEGVAAPLRTAGTGSAGYRAPGARAAAGDVLAPGAEAQPAGVAGDTDRRRLSREAGPAHRPA